MSLALTLVLVFCTAALAGVATAIAAARFGLQAEIYQGARDVERQALNAHRMRLFGAVLHPVTEGSQTLNDAVNAALRAFIDRVEATSA